jgi:hypothetical protein
VDDGKGSTMGKTRRNWLRPKWYVTDFGGFYGGSAYPDSMTRVGEDRRSEYVCVACGADKWDDGGGYRDPGGFHCTTCQDRLHPFVPLRGWRKNLEDADIALDNLYFGYCARFGKRVYR